MSADWTRPRTVIPMAVVFVALVAVLLWVSENEDNQSGTDQQPQAPRIQIKQGGQLVDLSPGSQLTDAEMAQLVRSRIQLLDSADAADRRAVAIQLAHITTDASDSDRLRPIGSPLTSELRTALFRGLNDADPVVSSNCRDALIGLWRICDSDAASDAFGQGLAAYEAGNLDDALATFRGVEALGGSVPPDLYRMTAEVYLAKKQPDQALDACRKAVAAEPKSFPALYVLARLYHGLGDDRRAMEALDGALSIYHAYPEALAMRRQIAPKPATAPAPSAPASSTPGS
jgi:tetratricopeptide (TPR) repeat protein